MCINKNIFNALNVTILFLGMLIAFVLFGKSSSIFIKSVVLFIYFFLYRRGNKFSYSLHFHFFDRNLQRIKFRNFWKHYK